MKMKSALTVVLFRLFTIGVFVDGKETSDVLVSVTEGDSVTLKSGVTDIQTVKGIEWRFNGSRIAKINSSSVEIFDEPDVPSKDRLQPDKQTGDLKISNIRTTDSGQYKVKIKSTTVSSEMTFTVNVVSADAVKPVSVMEGDSVTLPTGLTEIQTDGVVRWRFGQQESLIAEINRMTGIINTSDGPDGRFRDGLQLDQTGSLTITNISATHAGHYEVEISSSKYTIHKTFILTVNDDVRSVSAMEGDTVTLRTGLTEVQRIKQMLWKFGDHDELIADLNGHVNKIWSNADLNPQTGDLTISNILRDKYGDYKVEINTRRMILHRKYQITMIDPVKSFSGREGGAVLLQIVTEIQSNDLIHWMFGDTVIAEINKAEERFYTSDVPDGRFRGRLDLNRQTGSLNIMNTRITDSGLYNLKISSSRRTINRRITVTVTVPDTDVHSGSAALPGSDVPSGLSPGAVAGIVLVVVLVALAAVAAGVIYYRRKISELKKNKRDENGQNHEQQDTDYHANENTILETENSIF